MSVSFLDYLDQDSAADLVALWLGRIMDDDEQPDDVYDAASAALERIDALVKLLDRE